MRYDLKLDFKRMETVKAEKGYQGPVVVCAVYFTPVAGYIPDRPVIKYLAAQRNIEIAFAPVAGTRILVPFRMTIPTPLGTAMLEATQFITTADAAAGGQDAVRGRLRLITVVPGLSGSDGRHDRCRRCSKLRTTCPVGASRRMASRVKRGRRTESRLTLPRF